MARLHYSVKAFGRALQMSSVSAFVFVEGELDKAFLDRLVFQRAEWAGTKILIRLAREIDPSLGDGKIALLQLHTRLRRQHHLCSSDGKKMLILLDKDIDDLTRTKRRCPHVVYTDHYNVENYIYRFTRLQHAAADAALMPINELSLLGDQDAWACNAADSWKEWVGFCLAVRLHKAAHLPNLGCESLIHDKQSAAVDPGKLQPLLVSFAKAVGRSVDDARKLCEAQTHRFEKLIQKVRHDALWNGKWYGTILTRSLRAKGKIAKTANEAFQERLLTSCLSHLDFSQAWATSISNRLLAAMN